jgi:hypothetical protein
MSQHISLKEAEQKAFRTRYNDGLWDIFLGCSFLTFVIALYLGPILGDFWSSVALLPFWALVYLAIWLIRRYVVMPRIGTVTFGQARKAKLANFNFVMLVANVTAIIMGFVAALNSGSIPGQMISIIFGMILLMGFSMAAYLLDFNRLYVYGLLAGLSPVVGEWLWTRGYATHHGFPITFGTAAGIMILVGLTVFVRLLHDNPVPTEIPSGEA